MSVEDFHYEQTMLGTYNLIIDIYIRNIMKSKNSLNINSIYILDYYSNRYEMEILDFITKNILNNQDAGIFLDGLQPLIKRRITLIYEVPMKFDTCVLIIEKYEDIKAIVLNRVYSPNLDK